MLERPQRPVLGAAGALFSLATALLFVPQTGCAKGCELEGLMPARGLTWYVATPEDVPLPLLPVRATITIGEQVIVLECDPAVTVEGRLRCSDAVDETATAFGASIRTESSALIVVYASGPWVDARGNDQSGGAPGTETHLRLEIDSLTVAETILPGDEAGPRECSTQFAAPAVEGNDVMDLEGVG